MSFDFLHWITHCIFRHSPSVLCLRSCNRLLENECVNRSDGEDSFATHSRPMYEFTDMLLILQCPHYIAGATRNVLGWTGRDACTVYLDDIHTYLVVLGATIKEHLQNITTKVSECLHG